MPDHRFGIRFLLVRAGRQPRPVTGKGARHGDTVVNPDPHAFGDFLRDPDQTLVQTDREES